jgi:cell division protease FtsH
MKSKIESYAADHRHLLDIIAQEAGFADPVSVNLADFYSPLLKKARRGPLKPVDGVLVRDWGPSMRPNSPGFEVGLRLYEIEGIRFARVRFVSEDHLNFWGLDFVAVDRKDYAQLYRIALRCRRDQEPPSLAPVLPEDQLNRLWMNTIGYLEGSNLERIRAYGGRPKRGVLLTGAPGNGKTMACRWIWEACRQRRWEYRLVTPDSYRAARVHDSIEDLFSVERRGIIFFDDMDLALRDRDKIHETEDQAVFLSAMDGIAVHEGVVFVFTTNCSLELIDRAFKRPGRLDVVLHFDSPTEELRRRLLERWHEDIRDHLDVADFLSSTEGYSFAEIEELKNLLVMRFMETETWDWNWALKQFAFNRKELSGQPNRHVGFSNHQTNAIGFGRADL